MSDKIQEVFKELFYKKKILVNEKKKNFDLLEEVKNYMINKYESVHKKKFMSLYSAFLIKNKIAKRDLLSKSLIKYFKIWRGHTDNSQLEKYQIMLEEKEIQFHEMKIIKFSSILKNNMKKKFNLFLTKIEIYYQKKMELEFLASSYLFFENNYNIYLKSVLKGCFMVERIKHKIKKCPISIKEEMDVNFKENEFIEMREEDIEKNKKMNFSALEMFKNNNGKISYENLEKNYDTKGKFFHSEEKENDSKIPLIETNKRYKLNLIENYFYLWKAKIIKYSSLIKNYQNTHSNKITIFYEILNSKFLKTYHDFFTKISHIYSTYKYQEYSFDACEFYINNLQKKKESLNKAEFFNKFISLNYHSKINEESDRPRILYILKVLQKAKNCIDEKNKKIFYHKLGLNVKGSLLYNWSISTIEFVEKVSKILKSRFSQEFLYRLRIISQMEIIFKKPKIDYLIMNNTAEVIKVMHSSILTKTKNRILWKLLKAHKCNNERNAIHKESNLILLQKSFSIWVEKLKAEKKMLMNDAKEQDNINVIFLSLFLATTQK